MNTSDTDLLEFGFNCSLKKYDGILEIHIDLTHRYKFYKHLTIITGASSFVCLLIFAFGKIFEGLLYLITVFLISIPFIFNFLYYRNHNQEFYIDKSSQKIKFLKIFAHFKRTKIINFPEIKSLIYRSDLRFGCANISIQLKSKKMIKIYVGEKEEVTRLGNIISNFIEIPANHKLKIYYK